MQQYLVLLLAGWSSGVNLYLTIALLGLSGRFGWIDLPGGLEVISHPLVIAAAIFMYVIEFVADKVPFVDSAWDAIHTFIRPSGAALMGFLAGQENGPAVQAALAVLTGGIALDMHTVKASSRLAINTSPEPFSNIAASLAEDAAVIFLFWFFVKHPIIASLIILLILIGTFFILRMLWRFVLRLFRGPQAKTA